MTAPLPPSARPLLIVVLVQIGLMDLSLSVDNVIAAVGLAPRNEHGDPIMWPIYLGVLIAIGALQAIAPYAVGLLKRFPVLEPTAFVLIGYVGLLLMAEEAVRVMFGTAVHVPPATKFIGIVAIIAVALRYSADGPVRRLMQPVIAAALPLMRAFTRAVALLVWPLVRALEVTTRRLSS